MLWLEWKEPPGRLSCIFSCLFLHLICPLRQGALRDQWKQYQRPSLNKDFQGEHPLILRIKAVRNYFTMQKMQAYLTDFSFHWLLGGRSEMVGDAVAIGSAATSRLCSSRLAWSYTNCAVSPRLFLPVG